MSSGKPVSLIDIDSSGIRIILRLIRGGVNVVYCQFTPIGGFRRARVGPRTKRALLTAINEGLLAEGHYKAEIARHDVVLVSYAGMLREQVDARDVTYLYELMRRRGREGAHVIHVGLHRLGQMDRFLEVLRPAEKGMSAYFVPYPPLMRRILPVAGPDIGHEVRRVMTILAGRAQILPRLSYLEAEAIALLTILARAADYASIVELAQMLIRGYGVAFSKRTRGVLRSIGGTRWILFDRLVRDLLSDLEARELGRTLLARAACRLYDDVPKLLNLLMRPEVLGRRVRSVLVIGPRPAFIEALKNKYVVKHVTAREFLEKGVKQSVDLVILTSSSTRVSEAIKSSVLANSIVLDLNTFSLISGD